jgi:hypothetical protein
MSINNNVIVIDKSNEKSKLWCNLCHFVMSTSQDSDCEKKFGCCEECWLTFGQARQEDWLSGWRPDSETLNRYKQSRRIINISIMKILGE